MDDLTHIDLFSGIGGFSLAAESRGFKTVLFCEIDEFCQEVLKERFGGFIANSYRPGFQIHRKEGSLQQQGASSFSDSRNRRIPIIPNIRDIDGTQWRGATLLTGGFPCQPFSVAGQRRGKEDDRHLWPEMLRIIKEARPSWVIGENVAGIVRMELDQVLADLEDTGYSTQAIIIPACAKNAPHRRDRVWIIANDAQIPIISRDRGWDNGNSRGSERSLQAEGSSSQFENAPKSTISRLERKAGSSIQEDSIRFASQNRGQNWEIPWLEVATSLCGIYDGISAWLDTQVNDVLYYNHETRKESFIKSVSCLWKEIQSQKIREKTRRLFEIFNEENLLAILRKLQERTEAQDNLPSEGKKMPESQMRDLWKNAEFRRSPQRREYQKQLAEEFTNIVPSLPHESLLEVAKVCDELNVAFLSISTDRVKRLKALGNAIVPQIAQEIIKCIYQIEKGV